MKKAQMLSLAMITFMIMIFAAAPLTHVEGAAPTTGDITASSTVQTNIQFTIKLTNLATTAESNYYVVYVDSTTYGLANVTVVATSSTMYVKMKFTSAGSNTISLGGSTTIGGIAASAIASIYVTAETMGTGIVDTDAFTGLLPFLIPIAIVVGIVGIFKWRKGMQNV